MNAHDVVERLAKVAGLSTDGEPPEPERRPFAWTDLGNAERLVHWHGADLLHCHALSQWLVWDGQRWVEDEGPAIQARTVDVVRHMVEREGDLADDDDVDDLDKYLERFRAFARKSEGAPRIAAAQQLARNMRPVKAEQLDAQPWLLPTASGTLDLRRGQLRRHTREDLLTKAIGTAYDPEAEAPRWRAFVDWACCGDPELAAYLQRLAGYALTGDVSEQALVVFHGDGANGKSTFLEVLRRLLEGYAVSAPPRLFVEARNEEHMTQFMRLRGARLVIASEARRGRKLDEEALKRLTGAEAIAARGIGKDYIDLEPTWTIVYAVNDRPVITGHDHGIWRRIHLVPWEATVADHERNPHLVDELLEEEAEGILAWAVEGCQAWRRIGLAPTDRMRESAGEYRGEMDTLSLFLEECCKVGPQLSVRSSDLYKAYSSWTTERGERPLSMRGLGPELTRLGFQKDRTTRTRIWRGLAIDVHSDAADWPNR